MFKGILYRAIARNGDVYFIVAKDWESMLRTAREIETDLKFTFFNSFSQEDDCVYIDEEVVKTEDNML